MLIYVILLAAGFAIGHAITAIGSLHHWPWVPIIAIAIAGVLDRAAGHARRGRPLRPVRGASTLRGDLPDPPPHMERWRRWLIEDPAARTSCSFVEFDERGDYLDFDQHQHAYQTVMRLAGAGPLVLVIFVHGWRHSGQSENVLDFTEFLRHLSAARGTRGSPHVHGVYLAWRGGSLKHAGPSPDKLARISERFTGRGPLIAPGERARMRWLNAFLETFSYWGRKGVAEQKSSGTAASRTIFSCGYAARRNQPDCEVMLIGHSFGGLMIERTFQNAAISALTEAWPWVDRPTAGAKANPLPFDTVLLINSAAPSLYAKQFQSYLAAHRQAMVREGVANANVPIVFSLTSSADWATRVAHPIANALSPLVPTMWRKYEGSQFILELPTRRPVSIPQAYYYRRTPGHNPLLVNRFVERDGTSGPWDIAFPPRTKTFQDFSMYKRERPLVWSYPTEGYPFKETAYWIIRCPREIISSHTDIWSSAAMQIYSTLHAMGVQARG